MSAKKRIAMASVAAVLGGSLTGLTTGKAQTGAAAPVRYTIDVATTTAPMGGRASHELALKLGSGRLPAGGAAEASHFMPAGALLGASVPLATPTGSAVPYAPRYAPTPGQMPKGKLKIFWGCGAHAEPGQPFIVDLAAPGASMARAYSAMVPVDARPAPTNSRTYGEWPNAQSSRTVSPASSLIGQHQIKGNYTPDIDFALQQDFMPALLAQAGSASDGSVPLSWGPVTGATGYYAWSMGSDPASGDMVWWVSSATREVGGGLTDWLAPATAAKLVAQKVVMAPSQTRCTVPAEVHQATGGGMMMTQLYAYGPEVDVAYPPKPANAKLAWHPEWTLRARYRSATTIMPGMASLTRGLGGGAAQEGAVVETAAVQPPRKKCKPNVGGMLSGMFGGGRPSVGGMLGAAAGAAASAASCR